MNVVSQKNQERGQGKRVREELLDQRGAFTKNVGFMGKELCLKIYLENSIV